ncbi:hypothetical protein [Bosea sp. RAC05]|uniref:hypothetical protein n=1 Tax=Bosea sp. RAC05 TaxID=1842539 RepID=UPI0012372B28|nr:hypothetical protein [Bosea sp. RAC05]
MFVDQAALQSEILSRSAYDFVSHYIFEPVPFVFHGNMSHWINWKTILSGLIDVDPYDIVLVGSASVGFSLNPSKNYKKFDEHSDVDVGIISAHYFDLAWRFLRQRRPSWLSLPVEIKRAIRQHQNNYVFSGTIATNSMLGVLPFGSAWQGALDHMKNIDPTRGRDIKMRIYRDYDSLRQYQSYGVEQLKTQILEQSSVDDDIDVEDS